ncbi:MAG TPA: ATP-binding protein [Spirochaetota bacterium]|nr:ATP-binding protein [Spirochaetota bacterium]
MSVGNITTGGTGKTEFAKYLGQKLGLKVLCKRCSDLESMYVGETEKNIADAFREAEESGKILFIDEADTFFTDRNSAHRSWEISRTNEMLTQMENFRGIFICCTNMKDLLDSASIRRFGFKINFKPLRPEQKVPLYKRYFESIGTLTNEECRRIESIELLTPGDIRAVYNGFRYSNTDNVIHKLIIEEIKREVSHKYETNRSVIGF